MITSLNPVREVFSAVTVPPNMSGTTGQAVDLSAFVGPIAVEVTAGPGVTAPVTVTFQAAQESATNPCTPDNTSWAAVSKGGFCEPAQALAITVDPTADPYLTDQQLICRDYLQCPGAFVRAQLSAANPNITVHVKGKARRLTQA